MRKFLLLLCGLALSAGLVVGTGGFSSVNADRAVNVDVVGDEDAYMALEYTDERVDASGTVNGAVDVALVTATNQFAQPVNVSLETELRGDGVSVGDVSPSSATLGVGDDMDVSATLVCEDPGGHYVTVAFDATATGQGISAETTTPRTVEYHVECDEQTPTATTATDTTP
jgi:hypothetical protein